MKVSFRVVGLFCYFENLELTSTPSDTIQTVMDEIKTLKPAFTYTAIDLGHKLIVDKMGYDFTNGSTVPYNSSYRGSGTEPIGFRDLENNYNKTSLVWQYYRSVTGVFQGQSTPCEIKLINEGQPSFSVTPLNAYSSNFGAVPANFDIHTYNLTWRLVQIQMSAERQAKFMAARSTYLMGSK